MAKRTRAHDITEDRISDLPENLIDCILERLTIRDAARTSILSKKWRCIWAIHPQLIFDNQFFEGIKKNKQYDFVRIINKSLLLHSGPILKFSLYIPKIESNQIPDIDKWILVLSRNGIKKLSVHNSNPDPYNLPSYLFSCLELTHLELSNCILKPPLTFGGFGNLINLHLKKMSFSSNILGTLLPSAPVLQNLALELCTGIEHLKIHAPQLYFFATSGSHEFEWPSFERTENLRWLYIGLCKEVENVEQGKSMNLIKLLDKFPRIEELWLDGFSLKFLTAGTIPKWQPTTINNLNALGLLYFGFNDFDQISCTLCLLRSCPNLQILHIEASKATNDVTKTVINYLKDSECMDKTLDKLEIVELIYMKGLRAELLFIKLLLACSPSLERMIIELCSEIDANEECMISRELMRFSRASAKAKIIYLNPGDRRTA